MASSLFGIDIGGTKTALCTWSPEDGVTETARFATDSPAETLDTAKAALDQTADFDAVGIACGGPLDARVGVIQSPPNLPGWDDIAIVDELHRHTGKPVFLMNDANANALAEWHFGFQRDVDSLIYLTAGTGMGAGIILNRQLLDGATGSAGEIGHWRLAPDGPVGFGKAGSVEGYCSGGAMPELIRFLPAGQRPPDWENWQRRHASAQAINQSAKAGDPTAIAVLEEFARRLGQLLALLIDGFNPHRIVIGSLYLRCHEFVDPVMRNVLAHECLPPALAGCKITPSQLGEQLGNHGAIAAALHGLNAFESL